MNEPKSPESATGPAAVSWMAIQTESGNAIDAWNSWEEADAWWNRLAETEPDALPVVSILSFDKAGHAIEVTHGATSDD